MRLQKRQVGLQAVDEQLCFLDFIGIIAPHFILHFILLCRVVGFEHFQLCHLDIQIHLFFNSLVASSQHFHFRVGKGSGVHILNGAGRGLAGHDLADEFLLRFHQPPGVCVKGSFCHIAEDLYMAVLIAPADDTAGALL